MNWELPLRPAELVENRLINAIVDGDFPIGSTLPPERELARRLGVTRQAAIAIIQSRVRYDVSRTSQERRGARFGK